MEAFNLVIFGITSNLAQLKLIPALYDLEKDGLLPDKTQVIGIGRKELTKTGFENYINQVFETENKNHNHATDKKIFTSLFRKMHYLRGDFNDSSVYQNLKKYLREESPSNNNRLFYLATYPNLYPVIFNQLKLHRLNRQGQGWVRLMIEKPIGYDLGSSLELDRILHRFFQEQQIYRLDHYLGKETIQNILVFRFSNTFLQPLMNRDFVDHIQITAAEEFGIGKRGGYYDSMGALRDVGQNHVLQMLVVATMEAPSEFTNRPVTDERIKILKSLVPNNNKIIFGQYNGYLYEENVNPLSKTDTFFALKTEINNARWKGVPIYIRAGKHLARSVAEISIVFKVPDVRLFKNHKLGNRPNVLTYRIQPNEGIGLEIVTKRPGYKFYLDRDYMQFCYKVDGNEPYNTYEKLIYDTISGDPTFFNDSPEVEAAWKFVDKLTPRVKKPYIYNPGSWGPEDANSLIEKDGRSWIEPSSVLCNFL